MDGRLGEIQGQRDRGERVSMEDVDFLLEQTRLLLAELETPHVVSYAVAAKMLDVSERTLRTMIGDGRLERRKLGSGPQAPARITVASIRALTQPRVDTDEPRDD